MRFYTGQHTYYCGIDLHTKTMFLCILDQRGDIVLQRNTFATPKSVLAAIEPFRDGLVVAAERMFTWYCLADVCEPEGIPFVLGHTLYMRAIHGGKTKNDRIDAQKIAVLLRGGMFPLAHVYPKEKRATRDLLRRRTISCGNVPSCSHTSRTRAGSTVLNRSAVAWRTVKGTRPS